MPKEGKERKVEGEKDLEQLKKEIEQKGKEIEQLKKTVEEMRTQIQRGEKTGETVELSKILGDVSKLLDVGFSVFGTSRGIRGEKTKARGLSGLIDDLIKLAEKSETYQKKFDVGGKRGVIDFRISTGPLDRFAMERRVSYAAKPRSRIKISKPEKKPSIPPMAGAIKESEPIVDVFDEEDYVMVTAELPGVEEKDINLDVKRNTLTISAGTPARKYYKEVALPTPVQEEAVESSYRNGILEAKLKKA